MSKKSLFMSWLFVKVAVVGLLFVIFGFNYIFSDNFWYDRNFDTASARKVISTIGSSIDRFDQYGYTALMIASAAGKTGTVELLIKNGADVNLTAKNAVSDSPLHSACWNNNLDTIDILLKNNANPLIKNTQKVTPLSMIVKANLPGDFKKELNMFIAKGVDINYPDDKGRSILFAVVDQTQLDLLKLLQTEFAHLIDFDLRDKSGKTIKQFAATKGDIQDSIKPLVFKQLGPSIGVNQFVANYSFNENFTLMMVATIKGKEDYLLQAIKMFTTPETRPDFSLKDKIYGNSSLHWALLYNRLKCVSVIVKSMATGNKVDTNLKNKAGKAPIHCLWGIRGSNDKLTLTTSQADAEKLKSADRVTAAKLLSDFGANFNAQDDNGNTFLHNAVLWADVDFVKLITTDDYFVHRVNFNLKNKNNKTAFNLTQNYSYDSKYVDIANFLRNYNNISYVGSNDQQAGITALMLACMRGDLSSVKQLATKDNVNQKDKKNGDTPLHFAIRSRNLDVAKFLIEKGAKVDEKNNLGDAPLNEITNIFDRAQREEMAKLLLEKGCGISENKNGENIMHLAVRRKMPELILFLKQNLGKSEKNKDGKTAYDLAKEIGQKDDMKAVLDALDGKAPSAASK